MLFPNQTFHISVDLNTKCFLVHFNQVCIVQYDVRKCKNVYCILLVRTQKFSAGTAQRDSAGRKEALKTNALGK